MAGDTRSDLGLNQGDLAASFDHGAVFGLVAASPGSTAEQVASQLRIGLRRVNRMLKELERLDRVQSMRSRAAVRWFPVGSPAGSGALPRSYRDATSSRRRLMALLRDWDEDDQQTQRTLAERLGVTQQMISLHLRDLAARGLVVQAPRPSPARYRLTALGHRVTEDGADER